MIAGGIGFPVIIELLRGRASHKGGTNPVTRKSTISTAFITGILCIIFVIFVANGRPTFPIQPVVGTIWLAYHWRRRRSLPFEEDYLRKE
ncbi:Trk-type K+ transport system membrane component [Arthrobacter sp. CAN_A1]